MDIYKLLLELFLGIAATLFFSLLMYAPKKTVIFSSVLGGTSFILYRFVEVKISVFSGFFFAALLVAVSSEILARCFKMPAAIFIFPAVIPIVPGSGLYLTMRSLIEGNYEKFREIGTQTLFAFAAISIAIALTGVIARALFPAAKKLNINKGDSD